jgi:glyoxylase-like metal-dependent hydrolase (beta-lactamase superfamily II)
MLIESIEGGYDNNFTYIIGCEKSRIGAVIDAAVGAESILKKIQDQNLQIKYLILTHTHHDHYSWAEALLKKLRGVTLVTYGDSVKNIGEEQHVQVDDGESMHMGSEVLEFYHTPGHYPDSICIKADDALFTGDTLFIGRTGRTISAQSDTRQLYRSIYEKIIPMPDEITIYPGHNYGDKPTNTLGKEKESNKFLQAESVDDFVQTMEEYERNR